MNSNQARDRFIRWVDKVGGVQAAAQRLGCTKSFVSHVVNGRRGLGLRYGLKYQELDGVPALAWARPERAA
jgi:hypothetical protein